MNRSIFLKMRNVSEKSCSGHQHTFFMTQKSFFFRKSRLLIDNVERYSTAKQATEENMAQSHFMATNAYSEYVIFIAFPLQKWF
jgi:hypothetical protein